MGSSCTSAKLSTTTSPSPVVIEEHRNVAFSWPPAATELSSDHSSRLPRTDVLEPLNDPPVNSAAASANRCSAGTVRSDTNPLNPSSLYPLTISVTERKSASSRPSSHRSSPQTQSPTSPALLTEDWVEKTSLLHHYVVRFPPHWGWTTYSQCGMLRHEAVLTPSVSRRKKSSTTLPREMHGSRGTSIVKSSCARSPQMVFSMTSTCLLQPPVEGTPSAVLCRAYERISKIPGVEAIMQWEYQGRPCIRYEVVSYGGDDTLEEPQRHEGVCLCGPGCRMTFEIVCSAPESQWFVWGPIFSAIRNNLSMQW